jgi:hypothetical protein
MDRRDEVLPGVVRRMVDAVADAIIAVALLVFG